MREGAMCIVMEGEVQEHRLIIYTMEKGPFSPVPWPVLQECTLEVVVSPDLPCHSGSAHCLLCQMQGYDSNSMARQVYLCNLLKI